METQFGEATYSIEIANKVNGRPKRLGSVVFYNPVQDTIQIASPIWVKALEDDNESLAFHFIGYLMTGPDFSLYVPEEVLDAPGGFVELGAL